MSAHKSVWFASIFVAFIFLGLVIYTIKYSGSINAFTALEIKEKAKICYEQIDEKLIPQSDIAKCCASLSNSIGCQAYDSNEIADDLYMCKSDRIIVVNKALIDFCIGK